MCQKKIINTKHTKKITARADYLKTIPTDSGQIRSEVARFSLANFVVTKMDNLHSNFYRQAHRWFYSARNITKQALDNAGKFDDKDVKFSKLTGRNVPRTTYMGYFTEKPHELKTFVAKQDGFIAASNISQYTKLKRNVNAYDEEVDASKNIAG